MIAPQLGFQRSVPAGLLTSQGFALISQDNRYNTVRPEKAHMR
jgi:hypothetical protein